MCVYLLLIPSLCFCCQLSASLVKNFPAQRNLVVYNSPDVMPQSGRVFRTFTVSSKIWGERKRNLGKRKAKGLSKPQILLVASLFFLSFSLRSIRRSTKFFITLLFPLLHLFISRSLILFLFFIFSSHKKLGTLEIHRCLDKTTPWLVGNTLPTVDMHTQAGVLSPSNIFGFLKALPLAQKLAVLAEQPAGPGRKQKKNKKINKNSKKEK